MRRPSVRLFLLFGLLAAAVAAILFVLNMPIYQGEARLIVPG